MANEYDRQLDIRRSEGLHLHGSAAECRKLLQPGSTSKRATTRGHGYDGHVKTGM
ncbi:hypothetical protein AOL_s00054g754 [Orbilia oligospora ATCC 24927]|uniref:Uncharacterized protein n=1 Tax=Arthrobotrys oligospora (strain ATCC 24927 / CBS 115.81 / DSM 1491) TaxID=756982 RepID=G1X7B0_ARTOA|nr:hypothetical protein AOL_s00054g754 [Orbilia oligospora ATCC 24927]EGX51018.1 hypothetical protein AOL_s00054g754 [Orbilia oligospora ATCC 24927]